MKLTIYSREKTAKGSVDLPITEDVRPDLIRRAVHALQSRARQPYGADPRAGLKHATNVSKRRRKYRGSYGKGISRVPRKVLSKRGSQLYWQGAEAPGTVGGRRAHPPKVQKVWVKKINRKENRKAINSAIAATMDAQLVQQRGHRIPKEYPFAIDNDFEHITRTKDIAQALTILGFSEDLARGAGGGKSVLIVSEDDGLRKAARNIPGVDAYPAKELNANVLAPGAHPGRATLFTLNSILVLSGKDPLPKTHAPTDTTEKPTPAKTAKTPRTKTAKEASQ